MPGSSLVALVCLPSKDARSGRQRRRFRERRGQAGLLIALVLFVLANGGLSLLLHTGLAPWRDPFHARRLACLRRRSLAPDRPATVVLLGSSRTHFGLRASALEQQLRQAQSGPVAAFNFGKPGAGPVMTLYTWRRMCREGIQPALLLVEVSSFQFTEDSARQDTSEAVLPSTVLSPGDLAFCERYAPDRVEQLPWDWLLAGAVPWLSHRQVVLWALLPGLLPPEMRQRPVPLLNECGDGTEWEVPPPQVRERVTRQVVQSMAKDLRRPVPGERPARALRELLEQCRQRGVRVVLLFPPESSALRQALPAEQVRRLERFVRSTAEAHGADLVDARCWLGDDDFADGVHLSPTGAARFTERLGREVVLPGLFPPRLACPRRERLRTLAERK